MEVEKMNIFDSLNNFISYSVIQNSFGIPLFEITIIIALLILAFLIRNIFSKIILFIIKKMMKKIINKIDDQIFNSLERPFRLLSFILVFSIIIFLVDNSKLILLLEKTNQTFISILIFWILHQSLIPLSQIFYKKLDKVFTQAFIVWIIRSLKYFIIFLAIVAVLETWGIKIGPVIAGLGLFGVAVALGAQDLFKNLISGIMIILEKRFELNDVIELPGQTIGTVEQIGFRSTLIRQFDSTPISIPNYIFSDTSIINFSQRMHRQIKWIIGLTYNSSTKQLKDICSTIDSYIRSNNNFIVNDTYKLYVRVEKFNESSIDILVYAFTNTNDWEKYLETKEELAFKIKDIVEINRCSFAFPSKSIYIEKDDNGTNAY